MLDQQRADRAAIELLAPGRAGVAAVQDHAIVAHRPALLGSGEMHGIQIGADRHGGLLPMLTGIVGIENVATLANGHQTLTRAGHVQQGAALRQGTRLGRQFQHIDIAGCLGDSLQQHQRGAQRQPYILSDRTHNASSWKKGAGVHPWYNPGVRISSPG
ncbi:hypothetical protein D3C80_1551840 [compost metagenome]